MNLIENSNMINGYHHHESIFKEKGSEKCVSKLNGDGRENCTINYIKNPYINEEEDVLFHLTLGNKTHDLEAMFHDVKFVCMGGTAHRMKEFALFLAEELQYSVSKNGLQDLTGHGHRFSMFKIGCVLCVNHGMGYPSITILLHELIKLMQYANVRDPIFIRLGTSGGIDVPAGTVVIATQALNDYLEPCFEVPILGKKHQWPCVLDQKLARELKLIADEKCDFPVLLGPTVSNEQFYESTAMKAGAICEHSDEDRREYYSRLKSRNVLNMDMEAIALASLTHKVGIKAAVLNVVVNDSFTEEEDAPTEAELKTWQRRPQIIAAEYIKKYCNFKKL